ncbi:hypothetical protein BATDEDRAFT_28953 [Batrachochytrium dendrobatidis JAM81]|uniref:Uncharacterized protein n=1 Tax=Batrachochytrium dendrobatidis (strain JAM81 / FGSC 10211) TaxID=684364 RepID=F4PFQ8_BATDJ|nr:uncharacterized protein BATDEDRAFT_28953 [Batrachochytrium dendrobatidis JAM81]EGF75935.1 hypothetical protein BATDEDRAFT_28953 [Batrachochytrium dendrobatidis JAM81]|eukprot:XP_006683442.1 hypothetical protein BATDEDRAFT_28953 [Batrachochytrium dendrobatidis JAM81]
MIAVILIYSFLISGIFAGLDDFCQSSTASTSDQAPSTSGQRQSRPPSPPISVKKNHCFVTYLHLQGPCQPGELESYDSAVSTIKNAHQKLNTVVKSIKRGMSMIKLDLIQLNYEPDVQLASQGHTRESAHAMLTKKFKLASIIMRLVNKLHRKQLISMMSIQTRLFTRECPGIREILLKTSDHFTYPKMIPEKIKIVFGNPQGKYVSMFPKMAQAVGTSGSNEATQTTEPDQSTETDMQVD